MRGQVANVSNDHEHLVGVFFSALDQFGSLCVSQRRFIVEERELRLSVGISICIQNYANILNRNYASVVKCKKQLAFFSLHIIVYVSSTWYSLLSLMRTFKVLLHLQREFYILVNLVHRCHHFAWRLIVRRNRLLRNNNQTRNKIK